MRADLHTHSLYSFDGDPAATLPALCESAIGKGLSHLAVTDHCDINGEIEGIYRTLDKEAVFDAVTKAKQAYGHRLTILFGVELGQATQYPKEARALLERYPYDIVLGSLHNLAGMPDFYYMDFSEISQSRIAGLYERVLSESMDLLDFPGIHVLTHLTYMHRYVRRDGKELDFTPFAPMTRALFDKMIKKGVALELNTSSIADDGTGVPMPTREILTLYRDCGGKLISVGSDAHRPDRIARHFDIAKTVLTDCGFSEIALPTTHGILTFPIA